jgi:tetratricopeptide (TPR) repeat protein
VRGQPPFSLFFQQEPYVKKNAVITVLSRKQERPIMKKRAGAVLRFCLALVAAFAVGCATAPKNPAQQEPNRPNLEAGIAENAAAPAQSDLQLAAVYFNSGNDYYAKGDYDRAIADYNEAIRLNPNDDYAYNNRGNAYHAKGDYDRAIADCNEALRLNPNGANTYNNRGNAYYYKKDYRLARTDWEKALELDPNNVSAQNNLKALRQEGY